MFVLCNSALVDAWCVGSLLLQTLKFSTFFGAVLRPVPALALRALSMSLRMRAAAPLLLWAVLCLTLLESVCSTGVMRAGLGLQSDISLNLLDTLWSNKADLGIDCLHLFCVISDEILTMACRSLAVTYAKCDSSMCPPLEPPCKKPECPKVELQNTKEPPPKGYECHCEDPNEVPECGCLNECCAQRKKEYEEQKACECRMAMRVPSKAVTRIMVQAISLCSV